MANVSNDLTSLDFQTVKDNLKTYLSNQPIFKDYDFEASNINVLLDVLAYNTNLNSFYLNMIANEMFLDTALLRDSIISHAKELNYLPRSFRSAVASIDVYLQDNSADATVILPRGTSFTGTDGNRNFTFVTAENIQAKTDNTYSNSNFAAKGVLIYEGDYVSDSYVSSSLDKVRYICTNKTIDTNSLIVTVIEDNGATVLQYLKRDSLFGLGSTSQVFFVQPAENDTYEILFGDGVIGRPPKDNSVIIIEYRACNGELPNGIGEFYPDDNIDTATITRVVTNRTSDGKLIRASGGSLPEDLNSIKLNAPRAFTTQERVVTSQDYTTLLKANFSEINDAIAFGGEEMDPPQYGRVIIAIDLKNTDALPVSYKNKYRSFIKPRSPLSLDPVFVEPEYTYVSINSTVKYNINQTSLNIDDIKSLVISSIQEYNNANINGFGKTLRYSKLCAAIDSAQSSIVSNSTEVLATKFISVSYNGSNNYELRFNMPLQNNVGQKVSSHNANQISVVKSSSFKFGGEDCFFEDDGVIQNGVGKINIVKETTTTLDNGVVVPVSHQLIAEGVGFVNYETGRIVLENVSFQSVIGNVLTISVRPRDRDITAQQRSILRILNSDLNINIQQVRI